jgi:hypothetical protein
MLGAGGSIASESVFPALVEFKVWWGNSPNRRSVYYNLQLLYPQQTQTGMKHGK